MDDVWGISGKNGVATRCPSVSFTDFVYLWWLESEGATHRLAQHAFGHEGLEGVDHGVEHTLAHIVVFDVERYASL